MSFTCAEAVENHLAKILEERLLLFGYAVAWGVYYTFLDYTLYSNRADKKECSILQLARVDAWISTMVLCLPEQEWRGGRRQKMYADT